MIVSSITPPPARPGPASGGEDLKQAAQAFEAILLRQMLAASRNSGIGDELLGSQASETFRQMRDDAFADIASRTGTLGLAGMIEAQLAPMTGEE